MRVILNEYIHGLGQEGDVVIVKPGFGRNFLLPTGKALRHTEENLKKFETGKEERLARMHKLKGLAADLLKFLESEPFIITAQASQEGHLYGTVRPLTIFQALHTRFPFIKKESVNMPQTIKEIGEYTFQLRIHNDVPITATLYVFPSEEEAHTYIKERDILAEKQAAQKQKEQLEAEKLAQQEKDLALSASTSQDEGTETAEADSAPTTEEGAAQG